MLKAINQRISSWFALRRISNAERRADHWVSESTKLQKRLVRHKKKLEAIVNRFQLVSESMLEDLDESDRLIGKHSEALDSLNAELRICKELTIPGLIIAHQLMISRTEADVTVQVRKQVVIPPVEQGM